jgi:putative transcriptional regulator
MTNEILSALREAAKALRSGRGTKIEIGPEQIKKTRARLNLTQEEFADRVGVSVKTVQSWEQGIRNPGVLARAMIGALLLEVKQNAHA